VSWNDDVAPICVLFHATIAQSQVQLSVSPANGDVRALCEAHTLPHVVKVEARRRDRLARAAKRRTCASAQPTVHRRNKRVASASPGEAIASSTPARSEHQDRPHRHRLRSSNRIISLSNQLPVCNLIFFYQHHRNARVCPPGPGPATWSRVPARGN
jgi:hypothetical protein